MMNANWGLLRCLSRAGLVSAMLAAPGAMAEPAPARPMADVVPDTAPIPAHVKQRILDHMKQTDLQRLHGWPGIIFYCPVEEAKSETIKTICNRVNGEVGAMMAASGV